MKYEAWGACVIIELGRRDLSLLVKLISHCYPIPAKNELVSCQSISTPSKLLFITNVAKLLANTVESFPKLVGIYIFPNALINNLIPLSLYIFLILFLIYISFFPNIDPIPKTVVGLFQRKALSNKPELVHVLRQI